MGLYLLLALTFYVLLLFRQQTLWQMSMASANNTGLIYDSDSCVTEISDRRCFHNVHSFKDCIVFVLETATSIGYGNRYVHTSHCLEVTIAFIVTCVLSRINFALTIGIVFTKLSKPTSTHGVNHSCFRFSKFACVQNIDGQKHLTFRLICLRREELVGVTVKARMIRQIKKRDEYTLHQEYFALGFPDEQQQLLLLRAPILITHKIDVYSHLNLLDTKNNPTISSEKLEDFEIIIVLEGTIQSTGASIQLKTSYTNEEILWGYTFHTVRPLNLIENEDEHGDLPTDASVLDKLKKQRIRWDVKSFDNIKYQKDCTIDKVDQFTNQEF